MDYTELNERVAALKATGFKPNRETDTLVSTNQYGEHYRTVMPFDTVYRVDDYGREQEKFSVRYYNGKYSLRPVKM